MSKSQKACAANGWREDQPAERPLLILEQQFMDTLELRRRVQQVRIRSNGKTSVKVRLLFDGMAGELEVFISLLRKRLESLRGEEPHILEMDPASYWRLFATDSVDAHEQFEALLCGYAHYARQTSKAIESLKRSEDPESAKLLGMISNAVERCLWFLELYLEGLALNTDSTRLPEWSAALS